MTRRTKTQRAKKPHSRANPQPDKLPLIAHLHELRRRLAYVAVSVVVGSVAAYGFEHQLIAVLLRPSHGQSFIYTSPLGGINFLFSVCLYLGLVLSTPIIFYQLLAFLQPLMQQTTRKRLFVAAGIAGGVAILGVLFGYFVGLPSALHFLLHQFVTVQIRPLITIQSYMTFVGLYLLGSALMFQVPLIIYFINRITPLTPGKLLKYERHVIVSAFIIGFIMNPTPNLLSQMIIVVPIILMYQFSILMIWYVNLPRHRKVQLLLDRDRSLQAARAARAANSQPLFTALTPLEAVTMQLGPITTSSSETAPNSVLAPAAPSTFALDPDPSRRQYGNTMIGDRTSF